METKLGEIVDMLEYLVQQKNALGLREAGVEQMGGEDGRRSKWVLGVVSIYKY